MLDRHLETAFRTHSPRHAGDLREIALHQDSLEAVATEVGKYARQHRCECDFPNPYRGVDEEKATTWAIHFAPPVEDDPEPVVGVAPLAEKQPEPVGETVLGYDSETGMVYEVGKPGEDPNYPDDESGEDRGPQEPDIGNGAEDGTEGMPNFDAMTEAEIVAYAKSELGITLQTRWRKDTLIAKAVAAYKAIPAAGPSSGDGGQS